MYSVQAMLPQLATVADIKCEVKSWQVLGAEPRTLFKSDHWTLTSLHSLQLSLTVFIIIPHTIKQSSSDCKVRMNIRWE